MKIAVTGAGGFVGSALVDELLRRNGLGGGAPALHTLYAVDMALPDFGDARVKPVTGSIAEPDIRAAMFADKLDVVFHLAAIPGGAAAQNYELGWSVNVEASIAMLDALAAQGNTPKLVFASSIGIFGTPLPATFDDDTLPIPTLSYGAQKLIIETLITDMSRRGVIDGRAPRLPGIVARPPVKTGHISAFLSNIFHAAATNEAITLPVSAGATSWFMSRTQVVDNLIHAATLSGSDLPLRRAWTLPALRLSMTELVAALADRFDADFAAKVTWDPDPEVEAQFGAYPPLSTQICDRLGFRHDGDAATLIRNALNLTS